jgi:hypothetical protein
MTPDGVPGKKNGGLSKQQPTNKPLELLELDEDELLELLDELELPELDELELLLDVEEDDELEVDVEEDDELEVDDDDVELELDVESEEPRQQQIPIAPIIHRIFPRLTTCTLLAKQSGPNMPVSHRL